MANAKTFFLYPNANGSTQDSLSDPHAVPGVTYASQDDGSIITGYCNTGNRPKFCGVRITGITTAKAYVRVKSIYRSSSISIIASKANKNLIQLVNAQTMIDSTGRVSDVSRRLQVRVPSQQEVDIAEQLLGSMGNLCKKFSIIPGNIMADDGDPSCNPNPAN
jgi:hypothetical protein